MRAKIVAVLDTVYTKVCVKGEANTIKTQRAELEL